MSFLTKLEGAAQNEYNSMMNKDKDPSVNQNQGVNPSTSNSTSFGNNKYGRIAGDLRNLYNDATGAQPGSNTVGSSSDALPTGHEPMDKSDATRNNHSIPSDQTSAIGRGTDIQSGSGSAGGSGDMGGATGGAAGGA